MTNLENNDQTMTEETGIPEVLLSPNGEKVALSEVSIVFGDDGDDTIEGALNAQEPGSTLFGNAGNDYIRSRGIGDRVFGGKGNDTIVNDNGKAIIYGDLGSDYLIAKDSNTTLFGGRSFGEATAEEGKNILLSLGGKNILKGGGGNDSLVGEEGSDTMAGNSGNDTILSGPRGASFLFGNKGEDYLLSRSTGDPDTLFGGQGNDQVIIDANSTADAPLLFGGVGNDSLIIAGSDGNVDGAILVGDVNPDGTFGGSDGQEGNNYLLAESGKNHQLFGNSGNDTLKVGVNIGVGVSLFGGRGDDVLIGGTDAASAVTGMKAYGDKGDDTLIFVGSDSEFWGDNPNITTGFGKNFIQITGKNNILRGGNKNSTGTDSGNNEIIAIAPEDLGEEGETNNTLWGGAGDDTLNAGSSGPGDSLIGGPNGGEGNNTYIFGNQQTIALDTIGLNTYIGVNALETTVTVRPTDRIGGESNFVVTGDQSGVHQIEAGGVKTGAGNDFISIGEATGQTNAGDGSDTLSLGNVGGTDAEAIPNTVSGGAGDDVINVTGTDGVRANAVVDGGAGDDTITVANGAVLGKVFGGDGNDYIQAKFLGQAGGDEIGIIDGGAGNDTVSIDTMFGGAKVIGGEGDDSINVGVALAGATLQGGPGGGNKIILRGVGTDEGFEGENSVINITGGAGADVLGIGTGANYVSGTDAVRFNIDGGDGNDIIQGGRFGDTLKGGAGNDIIYGGSPTLTGANTINGLDLGNAALLGSAITAEDRLKSLVAFGDGDLINVSGGDDTVVFRSQNETGFVQTLFVGSGVVGVGKDINVGSSVVLPDNVSSFLVGSNGQAFTGGSLGATGVAFVTGAFNVDTLTGFQYGAGAAGDRIFIETSAFEALSGNGNTNLGTIQQFTGRGALFGGIVEGSAGAAWNADFFSEGSNVVNSNGFFYENFARGGSNAAAVADIDFNQVGSLLYDDASGGLYLGSNGGASLIAVLPAGLTLGGQAASDILSVGEIGDFAQPGIALF